MPDLGPPARQQVDRRDRLGEHGRVPVADRVHERAAAHLRRRARQCGVHGDGLEARGVVGLPGGAVEVIPHGDPSEAELFDPLPHRAQLIGGGVLQPDVGTEQRHGAKVAEAHGGDRLRTAC